MSALHAVCGKTLHEAFGDIWEVFIDKTEAEAYDKIKITPIAILKQMDMDLDMDPYMDPTWIPIWILYGFYMDPIWILHGSLYESYMDPIKILHGSI